MPLIFELAHWLGLVPLVWVAGRSVWARHLPNAGHWWLALAFGVSWLADTAAHWVDPWLVGLVYPVTQAAIIGAVLLPRREAGIFAAALVAVGIAAAGGERVQGPDVLLRTVAWAGLAGIVWPRRNLGPLRTALLLAFGTGWLAWLGYAMWPGWTSWGLYQGTRALGAGWFCWAGAARRPSLRILRRAA